MRIKSWEKFQHPDGKRNKTAVYPWIKFYRKLLDDREWFELDGDACKLLANCWLLAAERNGELPPLKDIAFRLRTDEKTLRRLFPKLNHWIEGIASGLLADCEQIASREEIERRGDGEGDGERETRTSVRGTRLEKDWWPSIEDCRYAESRGLRGDRLNTETEKFRNYWISKTGRDATKLDWSATWQNWVLRAGERQNGNGRYERKSTLVEIGERLAADAEALERAGNFGPTDDSFRGN